jgi:hypothetical protein
MAIINWCAHFGWVHPGTARTIMEADIVIAQSRLCQSGRYLSNVAPFVGAAHSVIWSRQTVFRLAGKGSGGPRSTRAFACRSASSVTGGAGYSRRTHEEMGHEGCEGQGFRWRAANVDDRRLLRPSFRLVYTGRWLICLAYDGERSTTVIPEGGGQAGRRKGGQVGVFFLLAQFKLPPMWGFLRCLARCALIGFDDDGSRIRDTRSPR